MEPHVHKVNVHSENIVIIALECVVKAVVAGRLYAATVVLISTV